jgi:hypothetical protein
LRRFPCCRIASVRNFAVAGQTMRVPHICRLTQIRGACERRRQRLRSLTPGLAYSTARRRRCAPQKFRREPESRLLTFCNVRS